MDSKISQIKLKRNKQKPDIRKNPNQLPSSHTDAREAPLSSRGTASSTLSKIDPAPDNMDPTTIVKT
jgi:hypothetical protein